MSTGLIATSTSVPPGLDELEVIATWRDVTDRVQAEEALADSEALLRGAFDEAPAGALLLGVEAEGTG